LAIRLHLLTSAKSLDLAFPKSTSNAGSKRDMPNRSIRSINIY